MFFVQNAKKSIFQVSIVIFSKFPKFSNFQFSFFPTIPKLSKFCIIFPEIKNMKFVLILVSALSSSSHGKGRWGSKEPYCASITVVSRQRFVEWCKHATTCFAMKSVICNHAAVKETNGNSAQCDPHYYQFDLLTLLIHGTINAVIVALAAGQVF